MADVNPTGNDALDTWLVDTSGNIAVSDSGVALLYAQLSPRCQSSEGLVPDNGTVQS